MLLKSENNLKPVDMARQLHRVFGRKKNSPLLWSVAYADLDSDFAARLGHLYEIAKSKSRKKLELSSYCEAWMETEPALDSKQQVHAALESVAVAWTLPQLGEDQRVELLDRLQEATLCSIDEVSFEDAPLVNLVLGAELPLTLHWVFSKDAPELPNEIHAVVANSLQWLLDENGWLRGGHLADWRPLLACWLRCFRVASTLGWELADETGVSQLKQMVWNTLRMMGPYRQLLLHPELSKEQTRQAWPSSLIDSLVDFVGDEEAPLIANQVLKNKGAAAEYTSIESTDIGEQAQVGVLRDRWAHDSMMAAVNFDQRQLSFELAREVRLLRGNKLPSLTVNGKILKPTKDWEVVCLHADDEIDFLELQLGYSDGVSLQRQFLLSYEDHFMMIADVVTIDDVQRIDYRSCLELPPSITAMEETENHEIYLRAGKDITALLMPLGISEWRGDQESNFAVNTMGEIELNQSAFGRAIYAPIWIDLNPVRCLEPRTWKPLTVGESLELIPKDVATAFRIQVGLEQWVLYRSLGKVGNRTFLGENQNCELFLGRFKKNGAEEMLLVE